MNQSNFADIEYSKQLKDEFPDSEWWWTNEYCHPSYISKNKIGKFRLKKGSEYKEIMFDGGESYPALTTNMLLEKLPEGWEIQTITGSDGIKRWFVHPQPKIKVRECFNDKKLPNTLAKMLIWLKGNKLEKN